MAGLIDEIDVKGLYGGVTVDAPLSAEEARDLGLPQLNPLQDELERVYKKHVTEDPEQNAARVWNAQRVGVPQWIQESDEMYKKEAEARLALLDKGSPDWKMMVALAPVTAKFLSYDDVMSAAHDDTDNLAAMENEAKRVARVKKGLNGLLQRGASGRGAILRSLKSIAPASAPAAPAGETSSHNAVPLMGRDTIVYDESNPFKQLDVALGNWFRGTDLGKGVLSGEEMSAIGRDATNLFARQSAGGKTDESEWVDLEKRMLALDREAPSGWFGGMLYETGKMIGQQIGGAMTTGGMATIGALGAIVGGGGLAALAAPAFLPALAVGATMSAAAGWALGTATGVFTQSAQVEGGFDVIDRRMMKDANGNYLSPMAVGLGSMAVGAVNGAIELLQWETALGPMNKIASAAMRPVISKVGARIAALPAMAKIGGTALKDWGVNVVTESMQEVLQDAFPIAIDELQKASLLDGYDARTIGDINAQLIDTFAQSLYSFALISAIGPVGAGIRGDYRIELVRKEIEAYQTEVLNDKLDNFKSSIGAAKLLKRIPGMTAGFASELLDNADARKVFLPAAKVQTLFQDGRLGDGYNSAEEWAQDVLEVDPKDFRESLDGGPEIEVEAIRLFDKISDAVQDELRGDMRFSADGMTLGEAQALGERITRLRNTDLFDTMYDIEREAAESKSALKVYDALRLQLASNGMDDETASGTAWLASRMYIPLARMWNDVRQKEEQVTPEDVAKMFPITFGRNDDGSMGMYFQASGSTKAELEAEYKAAIQKNDMEAARDIVAAYAAANGYTRDNGHKGAHLAPYKDPDGFNQNIIRLAENDGELVPADYFEHPEYYIIMNEGYSLESLRVIKNALEETRKFNQGKRKKEPEIWVYRAVNNAVEEGSPRNADWVSPSKAYAQLHGDSVLNGKYKIQKIKAKVSELYWDANDINEWGFDDGRNYAYKNTENNRKLFDAVVYDDNGDMVPLSQRFQDKEPEVYFQENGLNGKVAWEQKLADENIRWNKTLSQFVSGPQSRDLLRIMDVPLVLRMLGNMEEGSLVIGPGKLNRLLEEHKNELDIKDLENLPELIANPVMVLNSSLHSTHPNSVIVVINVQSSKNGASVFLPISLVKKNSRALGTHYQVSSIYTQSRNGANGERIANPQKYRQWIEDEELLVYADLEQLPEWEKKNIRFSQYIKNSPSDLSRVQFPGRGRTRASEYIIKTGKDLVKERERYNDSLYQSANGQHRGSIIFPRQQGQPIRISWSKDADASTVIHELGHFYLWQLRQFKDAAPLVRPARAIRDLETISNWWAESAGQITGWIAKQNGFSDDIKASATDEGFLEWLNGGMETASELGRAFDTAAHEYFARGFEAYLREGRAPTSDLQSVFRRFKAWLVEIYRNLTSLDVELSDDMRAVYDRMLATEDAINQFRAEMEVESILNSDEDVDIEDVMAPYADDDPYEAAKERLLGILMDEISAENRKKMVARADEIRPRIAAEVSAEKGWATVNMYEENPDRRMSEGEILDRYGEAVVARLSPAVMDPDGISLEIAAKDMGYGSADELIEDLKGKTSIQAEIDARVRAQIEREFASIITDPAKLDAAAEAAWYEGEGHEDELAADIVVPMSEYAEVYAEDEAASAEEDSPRNRRKVIGWIRSHGGILYSSVAKEFGSERAQELIKRTGPGVFSKTGFGLDELAQELSGEGVPVESDEDLFGILMGQDARRSPLDVAREEGKAEAKQEERLKRALKAMSKRDADKRRVATKAEYNARIKEIKDSADLAAKNIVIGMTVEGLSDVKRFIRAERDARNKADRALRKNNEGEYRHWRERELMQHMIVKQMYRHLRLAEGIRSWLERYAKRTNTQTFGMTPGFVEQVDALLTRFNIKKSRNMSAKQRASVSEAPSLENFIREMDAEGTPILIPDWILNSAETRHYTQLMFWQLQEVKDAVKNIVTVGRQEKQTISLAENEKLSDIADKIYAAAKAFWSDRVTGERVIDPKERKRGVKELAKGYLADLETIEAMCRALDGYKDLGPAHRYIFQPIRTAMTKETLELNRVFALAREIRDKAYNGNPQVDNWTRQFDIPVYKRVEAEPGKFKMVPTKEKLSLTREQAICAVLNMGNEGNLARLRDGWGWTQDNMAEILNSLAEQDIRYIEGIWDLVESMWPAVKKVSELMTGMTLAKVEAKPLVTKFGTLKGGYYPIVTDLRYSTVAAAQNELETALASATLNYAHSHTKSGHRKARAVDVLGRPPLLSLGVLDNHLANVIHDAAVAPALRDVRKVLKNQLVETTILEVLGEDRKKNINKWLNDVASNTKNNGVSLSKGEVIANRARSGVAMFALGGNLGGALMQPLGYFPLAHRIGFVRTARAILNGLMGNTDIYSFVLEKSEFMREQYNGQNVEVRRLRENWSSQKGGLKWWQDGMLSIYPMLQNLCNVPGWAEAYKMGIEKYEGNEADAIAYADSVIRQTQSASNLADLSTLERSGTFGSLITMFYSWFRVMYQMQNEALVKTIYGHGLRGRFGDLASYALYVLIAQGVAESLLRGYGPDDDDDEGEAEKWAKWTAQRLMLAPMSTIPIARDIMSYFEIGQYRFTPVEAAFKSVSKLVAAAYKAINPPEGKERDFEPLVWSGAEVVGYGTGLPNRAMLRAAKAFWALYNEDEAIPWAYVILGGGYKPAEK